MPSSDPGSFRDPSSRVVHDDGRVLRLLNQRGAEAWQALSSSTFFSEGVASGKLIESTAISNDAWDASAVIEHPRLDMITYPYEWTFEMLKDAALLHLELLESALRSGFTMKDATPYNIQFVANRPMFIDLGSFEPYQEGEPWIGYRQFSRLFLFPLLIRAWADVPFQPLLRGRLEGPTATETRNILKSRKRFSSAALLHVKLQARLEQRMAGAAVRDNLRSSGFNRDMILTNVAKLTKLVSGLEWNHQAPGWTDYHACDHVGRDRDNKADFLRKVVGAAKPGRMLDLGANDAHFSLVAASAGTHAIAVDGDEAVLDAVYRQSQGASLSLALSDLTDASPSQGWAGVERPSLFSRSRPDLVLAYGLIHHLIYTASVPPRRVVEWLRSFACPVVVEFVAPEDPMVDRLVANKTENELHPDRSEAEFLALLAEHFTVVDQRRLGTTTRLLLHLTPR